MVEPDEREVLLPEERLTLLPAEREVPEVDGARLTEDALRVVTPPERLADALRVVIPERPVRLADVDLVAELALRLPAWLRVDVMLRPAERAEPPWARELPA